MVQIPTTMAELDITKPCKIDVGLNDRLDSSMSLISYCCVLGKEPACIALGKFTVLEDPRRRE